MTTRASQARRLRFCILALVLAVGRPALVGGECASEFSIETVGPVARPLDQSLSLAIGPDDAPRIAYHTVEADGAVRYAARSTNGWMTEFVSPAGAAHVTLFLDAQGAPHILLGLSGLLQVAQRSETSWSTAWLAGSYSLGPQHSAAVGNNGHAQVIYQYGAPSCWGGLQYGRSGPGGWTWEDFPPNTGCVDLTPDIALDSKGDAHIVYAFVDVCYLRPSQSGTCETIAQGRWTSIVVDSHNRPHVSYYHEQAHTLQHAVRTAPGLWQSGTVDAQGDVGQYATMAIDATDRLHIAYYDVDKGDLKYALWDALSWKSCTVDAEGDVGVRPSIAVDSKGHAHIAYFDVTHAVLKYATTLSPVTVERTPISRVKSLFR